MSTEFRIQLTQGRSAVVDEADYVSVARFTWYALRSGRVTYAARAENGAHVLMHRQILGLHGVSRPLIDHIDRDGLNNRRRNLRRANPAINALNRGDRDRSRPGAQRIGSRFKACLQYNGVRYRLGCFDSAQEAQEAYAQKYLEIYGERLAL